MKIGQLYIGADGCIRKIMKITDRFITYKYITSPNYTNLLGKSFTRENTHLFDEEDLINTRLEKIIYDIEDE